MKAAGLGFRAGATEESLRAAYDAAGGDADVLAVPEDKRAAPLVMQFAAAVGLPVVGVSKAHMTAVKTLTQSAKVREKRGTGSVAEACALVAAGDGATLLGARVVSSDRNATCAMAEAAR